MRRYHYSLDDQTKVGPVTLETLRAKAVAGELQPHHFVFAEGEGQWTEARLIDGVFPNTRAAEGKIQPPIAPRARPAGLRPLKTSDYASTPRARAMPIARGLYGPPEPCPLRYRAAAAVADAAILSAILALIIPAARAIARSIGGGTSPPSSLWFATFLALTITPWLYHAGMECSPFRATLAKIALTMRVVDDKGQRLSFRRATLRHFAKALSLLPLGAGFFWAWFDPSLRTWHDRLTRTAVHRTPPV